MILKGRFDDVELFYGSVPGVLSELIRTAFIPEKGKRFIVADFSAIEARVIAWLAGEDWRLEIFKTHGKIYEASASRMFKVPIGEVTKGSDLRQKGKICELAFGFGGGVGALKAMGEELPENEMKTLVSSWRSANPNIVKFWRAVEEAAKEAVREKVSVKINRLEFKCNSGFLFITLPSGRKLSYIKPRIEKNKYEWESITYEGVGTGKSWERIETYGGKLAENCTQAIARDILAEAMLRLDEAGYRIVMHCHDEVVLEVEKGKGSVDKVCRSMSEVPEWADGLPLAAEGYECEFYRKA